MKYVFNDIKIEQYRESLLGLLTDGSIQKMYANIDDNNTNINEILKDFQNILKTSSNGCLRHKKFTKRSQPKWFDKDCKLLKTEKFKCLKRFRRSRCNEDLETYLESRKSFKALCAAKKSSYNSKQLDDLLDSMNNPNSFWKKVKNIVKSKRSNDNNISNDDWKNHFASLFSYDELNENANFNVDEENGLDINFDEVEEIVFNAPITDEEILKSVKALNMSKSPGLDGLPPGIFKHSIDIILPIVKRFFNRLFDLGEFPEDWAFSFIVPVHKKGDKNRAENYRGISLLDIFGKIYTSIINRRLIFVTNLYSIISESQAGFRDGYSTIDNLFILQAVISKYLSKRRGKVYIGFVDFKAAFDSVHRDKLWSALNRYGIKGKLLNSIKAVYKSVKSCVKVRDTLTESFDCHIGVRQGCMISPILFSLFINEFAELIEQSGLRGIQLLPDLVELFLLMFADDVALLSDTVVGLQRQFNLLCDFCKEKKLKVNIPKTKVVVCKNGSLLSRNENWTFDGEKVEVVNAFTYLGLTLSMQLSFNRMASDQAIKAKRVLVFLLNSLYELGQLPKDAFFKLFDRKISPVLLYGSEIWGFTKRESVELVQRYACKRYMCVGLRACNAAVLGDCGRFPIWIESAKRCIKYWIKILSMPDTRYVKKCYSMLKLLDDYGQTNWATNVKQLLFSSGFGYVWLNQHVPQPNRFISALVQRLRNQSI